MFPLVKVYGISAVHSDVDFIYFFFLILLYLKWFSLDSYQFI